MLILELWVRYYIFIRRIYKNVKRYDNMNTSIGSLAYLGLFIQVLFYALLISYIFNYQGIKYIFTKGLPLSLFVMIGFTILFSPAFYAYGKLNSKTKIKLLRKCLKNTENSSIVYPIIYVVIIVAMAFASFMLLIMNIPDK